MGGEMKKLLLFLLLASCRQFPSPPVVDAVWPPKDAEAAVAVDAPDAVSPADIASPATAP